MFMCMPPCFRVLNWMFVLTQLTDVEYARSLDKDGMCDVVPPLHHTLAPEVRTPPQAPAPGPPRHSTTHTPHVLNSCYTPLSQQMVAAAVWGKYCPGLKVHGPAVDTWALFALYFQFLRGAPFFHQSSIKILVKEAEEEARKVFGRLEFLPDADPEVAAKVRCARMLHVTAQPA